MLSISADTVPFLHPLEWGGGGGGGYNMLSISDTGFFLNPLKWGRDGSGGMYHQCIPPDPSSAGPVATKYNDSLKIPNAYGSHGRYIA